MYIRSVSSPQRCLGDEIEDLSQDELLVVGVRTLIKLHLMTFIL